jgi:pyruvate dehydrogenase E2 component (dihydrolipoamide acetyltransferase)
MEALSPTMEEGQLVRWLKAEGDAVANGDILAEIETDKATMELVARGEGVLRKIFVAEGVTAPVGEVIAVIAAADEDVSGIAGPEGLGASAAPEEGASSPVADDEAAASEPPPTREAAVSPEPSASDRTEFVEGGEAGGGRVRASPLARRMAEEAAVDLGSVPGSGPGGRIVMRDVEAAKASGASGSAGAHVPRAASIVGVSGPEFEDLPNSQMRKTIAKRLVESLGPVPHFFLRITVDMSRTLAARKRLNELLEGQGDKVSINDFVLKATGSALARHPEVNAQWMGEGIRRHHRVHLGVAVAVEDGLITPVLKDANLKGLAEISREIRELAGRGREKRLQPEEYTGSTFSVSNLGMFGIQEFTGVINPPEAGILAVGGIEESAVVQGGEIVVRPIMTVTMSCDHRVIDGATGARFMQTLKEMLEEPAAILV